MWPNGLYDRTETKPPILKQKQRQHLKQRQSTLKQNLPKGRTETLALEFCPIPTVTANDPDEVQMAQSQTGEPQDSQHAQNSKNQTKPPVAKKKKKKAQFQKI